MMELTEKTELGIEDSYFHYTINDIIKPIRQQILENQQNSNPIYREFYEKWHYVLQENKQLKEDKYNQGVTLGNQFDLLVEYKQKLEKIKELNELSKEITGYTSCEKLKEILDSQEKTNGS